MIKFDIILFGILTMFLFFFKWVAKFENPKLKLLDAIDNSGDKVGLVKKVLLNKDISDGVKAKAVNRLTKNKISQGAKTSYISTKSSNF